MSIIGRMTLAQRNKLYHTLLHALVEEAKTRMMSHEEERQHAGDLFDTCYGDLPWLGLLIELMRFAPR